MPTRPNRVNTHVTRALAGDLGHALVLAAVHLVIGMLGKELLKVLGHRRRLPRNLALLGAVPHSDALGVGPSDARRGAGLGSGADAALVHDG